MFDHRLFIENPLAARVSEKARQCWGALGRNPYELQRWVENFDEGDRALAWHLLIHFTFHPPEDLGQLCRMLMVHRLRPFLLRTLETQGVDLSSNSVRERYRTLSQRTWLLPIRDVRKGRVERGPASGDVVLYYCRGRMLQGTRDSRDLASVKPRPHVVALVDDFVGTGGQANRYIAHLRQSARWRGWRTKPELVVLALAAMRRGIDAVRDESRVALYALNIFEEEQRAFSEASRVFPDPVERAAAEVTFRRYGGELWRDHALGYEEGQLLAAVGKRAPNNTLPIFWETDKRDGDGSPWQRLVEGSR